MRNILLALLLAAANLPAHAQSAADFAARARELGGEGRHAEAASLFERAIEGAPRQRDQWLGEYADQLAFSGSADAAVPLYREIISDLDHPEEERERARRRLALALFWGWNLEEAVPALRAIAADNPDDGEVGDALQRASAALAEADAAGLRLSALEPLWNGDYAVAIPRLRRLLRDDPADAELRRSLADALAGAARSSAEQDDYQRAIALFDEAARVDPSRADLFARQEAEQLLYGGLWDEAEPRFRKLLTTPSLSAETQQAALLGLARTYAWSGRPEQAVPVYDSLLALEPGSVAGLTGRGQALADRGDYRRSRADFVRALEIEPDALEGLRGRARATLGLERPREALAQLASVLSDDAADPGARLLAARARRSMGRPDIARQLAQRLIAEGEIVDEATAFVEELLLEQMPFATLEVSHAWQSDGLRVTGLRGRQTLTFDDGLTTLGFQAGVERYRGENFPEVDLARLGVFGSRKISDAFALRGSAVLNIREAREGRSHSASFEAGLDYLASDAWRFGLNWNRRYAGDTSRAIAERIFAQDFGISAAFSPAPEFRMGARATWTWVSDGNRRISTEIDASTRVLSGDHQVWIGARAAAFAYDRTSDFYWSPLDNTNLSATLQASGPLAKAWRYDVSGSLGYSQSHPDDEGLTYGIRGQLSRAISEGGSIAVTASHASSLARTTGAGSSLGGFDSVWNRSEIGIVMRFRF